MHARAVTWLAAGGCAPLLVGALACSGSQRSKLAKAGDDKDEGAGELAQASMRLSTPDRAEPESFTEPRVIANYDYALGGGMYGGDPYGGFAYGGRGYGGWAVPQWTSTPANRMPRYNVISGLRGAIEGTVTWTGKPPGKLMSACGLIDNPTLRVGTDKAARGVIVYIEKVALGRGTPYYARPAGVGGVVAKRGCTFVPAAQIVAPLPGPVSIHGDEERAKVRVAHDKVAPTVHDLQEGGLVQVEAKGGVTRVDAPDGKLSAAWVIGLETPYYAITDDAGRYRIDELAAGTYEITFWQPPVATTAPDGTFTYGPPTIVRRSVKIGARPTQLSVAIGR